MDGPKLIPTDRISPSPFNPRRVGFTPADLADLTASVKEKGVLFPVTVRVHPKKPMLDGKGKALPAEYELVDGERRFRAAMFAGLAEVPAHVVDMTDEQVRDAQLISFDQKADLLPSERAAAYQREIDAGRSAEDLAAKVGRSVTYVRNVLRIAKLSDDFLAHVDAGRVHRATAELVARVPGERARTVVELCVLQRCHGPEHVNARAKPDDEPLSYRDAKELIAEHFMVELKGVPWGMKDLALLPAAGPCETCPKRAGNAGEEFKDVRADVCLDPPCYRDKLAAFRKREEAEAKKGGKPVLTKAQADKVFSPYNAGLAYDAAYVDLNATCPHDTKQRTYAQILAKVPEKPVGTAVGYHPRTGERFELADRGAVTAAIRAAGVKVQTGFGMAARATGPKTDAQKKEEARRRLENKIERATVAATLTDLAGSAEALFKLVLSVHSTTGPASKAAQVLLGIVGDKIDRTQSTTAEDVVGRRGMKPTTAEGNRKAIAKAAEGMDASQLLGLLVELVGHQEVVGYSRHRDISLLQLLAVDRKAIEARVKDEVKAQAAAKKAGKATPSANGKHAPAAGAPKLTDVMKGEAIAGLGVTAEGLEASKIVGRVGSPAPKKPVKVKPAHFNGRDHVCTGSMSGPDGQAWICRPLWDFITFTNRHPGVSHGAAMDMTSDDPYLGVAVTVHVAHKGPVEMYVGSRGEERRLIKPRQPEPSANGHAAPKAKKRQPAGV